MFLILTLLLLAKSSPALSSSGNSIFWRALVSGGLGMNFFLNK
jgi:hypothetical protein